MSDDHPKEKPEEPQDLQLQLDLEKKRSQDYLTHIQYLQADFENLRKRCDRQIQQVSQYSNERLIIQLLEVMDELELAIKNAQTNANTETLVDGVQLTLKRLRKVLEQEGVSPIEAEGKPFDPSKHNAIAAIERPDIEGCVIVEEVRKGYMMKEKVIRPSIVKVSVKPKSKSQNKEENKLE
jgi:molecular chaperone GrpE